MDMNTFPFFPYSSFYLSWWDQLLFPSQPESQKLHILSYSSSNKSRKNPGEILRYYAGGVEWKWNGGSKKLLVAGQWELFWNKLGIFWLIHTYYWGLNEEPSSLCTRGLACQETPSLAHYLSILKAISRKKHIYQTRQHDIGANCYQDHNTGSDEVTKGTFFF